MSNIVIHHNNVDLFLFEGDISFDSSDDIDKYISKEIIPKLLDNDFDRIFIKDNLSSNYLELVGLRVAYHIRLSQKLGVKRFSPIIILSDLDSHTLNKLESMAKILFTKNIFIISNTKDEIEKFQNKEMRSLGEEEWREDFLNLISVEPPKDYLTHHSIANEWSMYRWAEYLDVNTPDVEKIKDDISSMLYFKYLQSKFLIKRSLFGRHKQEIQGKGKILYIDDEWEKGWKSIFEHLSQKNKNYSLETVEEVYKDKSQEDVIKFIMKKVDSFKPDVIILDMRLHENDFLENIGLADFTGIQIFNEIKEINPGIQIIIFTASSNSLLLDQLNSYDSSILGYVKKEHPKNYNLTTQGNINKLISLINKGLERKYLKDIYLTKFKIENILENDIFAQYFPLSISDEEKYEKYEKFWIQLQVETIQVFDILSNSSSQNKFKYAMVSIASSMEAILSIFIIDVRNRDNKYWDGEICRVNTLNTKLNDLFYYKLGYEQQDRHRSKLKMKKMIDKRNDYLHSRKEISIAKKEIESWFNKLLKMIEIIENPPNLHRYDTGNMVENLNDALNNR